MNIREEFIKSAIECLPQGLPKARQVVAEKYATLWANECIENSSIEFVLFKLGFIKGEEQGSKK